LLKLFFENILNRLSWTSKRKAIDFDKIRSGDVFKQGKLSFVVYAIRGGRIGQIQQK